MNVKEATASYEKWMRRCTNVISSDLLSKHRQMKREPLPFFAGNFLQVGPTMGVNLF